MLLLLLLLLLLVFVLVTLMPYPRRIRATLAPCPDVKTCESGAAASNGTCGGGCTNDEDAASRGGVGAGRALLEEMHPTAAVCGKPRDVTYSVIGEVEGFDRYAAAAAATAAAATAATVCCSLFRCGGEARRGEAMVL